MENKKISFVFAGESRLHSLPWSELLTVETQLPFEDISYINFVKAKKCLHPGQKMTRPYSWQKRPKKSLLWPNKSPLWSYSNSKYYGTVEVVVSICAVYNRTSRG